MRPKILSIVAAPPGWQVVLQKSGGGYAFFPLPCFALCEQDNDIRTIQSIEPFYFSLDGLGHIPRMDDPERFVGVAPPGMSPEDYIEKKASDRKGQLHWIEGEDR